MSKGLRLTMESVHWRKNWLGRRWYPHEYIIESRYPQEFKVLSDAIAKSPFYDFWKGQRYSNLYAFGYKFWRMQDVINRKPAQPPKDGSLNGGEQSFVWAREHKEVNQ